MLRDSLIAVLGPRLGNRTDLDAAMVTEMQFIQETLLEGAGAFLPWFLETEMSSATTTAGDERVPLPTDYLGTIEDEPLWLYDATATTVYTKLTKDSPGYIKAKYPGTGIPKRYALTDDYFLLAPIPDAVYTLKMRYYAKDAVLSTNIENKWLKHAADVMLAELGKIMAAKYLQNAKLANDFEHDAAVARSRLYVKHEARAHQGRTYQMGED